MLVCNICESKATYKLIIDCGRFDDKLYFCDKHIPLEISLIKLDEKQNEIDTLAKQKFGTLAE